MKMTISRTVNAPLADVFRVYSDFENAVERVDGIEKIEILTDCPIGVGTRFKETRTMFGRESTEEMEITEFESNKSYTVEAFSCGARFQTIFRFVPKGEATDVEVRLSTQCVSLFAKLMSPLEFLMSSSMKKCFTADVDQLKKYCEQSVTG